MKSIGNLLHFLLVVFIGSLSTHAATVTTCDEANLRDAIAQGGRVTFACDGVIALSNPLVITQDSVLDATGRSIVLSGDHGVRVFEVIPGASLKLANLTVANGRSTNGGGIFNRGTLTLTGCTLATNTAEGISGTNGVNGTNGTIQAPPLNLPTTPGGIGSNGEPGQPALGGGLYNLGVVFITNSTFVGNQAIGGRGGNAGDGGHAGLVVHIVPVQCTEPGLAGLSGAGGDSFGAAFYNAGDAMVSKSTFLLNSAIGGVGGGGGMGGGIGCYFIYRRESTPPGQGGAAQGGGWFNQGALLIEKSLVRQNNALGGLRGGSPETYGYSAGMGGHGGDSTWRRIIAACCARREPIPTSAPWRRPSCSSDERPTVRLPPSTPELPGKATPSKRLRESAIRGPQCKHCQPVPWAA